MSDCKTQQRLIATFLVPLLVALKFKIKIAVTEDAGKPVNQVACALVSAVCNRSRNWSLVASGKTDQSGRELLDVFECGRSFGLFSLVHLETCDELAKILVASLRCTEQE